MIIPVRCFTCGKILGNKYNYYQTELVRRRINETPNVTQHNQPLVLDINIDDIKKTVAGEIMDELGLTRMCCRKTMLSNVHLIENI
jgi:DNA-directed RNA polymerase subunit N (RpoN/RPB10)